MGRGNLVRTISSTQCNPKHEGSADLIVAGEAGDTSLAELGQLPVCMIHDCGGSDLIVAGEAGDTSLAELGQLPVCMVHECGGSAWRS